MANSEKQVEKELDLVKFLQRSRLTIWALLALLNTRQQFMVDKMATMVLRESSGMDEESDDWELEQENMHDVLEHGKRSITSSNIVDQNLIGFYKLKRWSEESRRMKNKALNLSHVRDLEEIDAVSESDNETLKR